MMKTIDKFKNSIGRHKMNANHTNWSRFLAVCLAAFLSLFVWAAAPAQAATLPAETCTYDALSNTRTCELWAAAGTLTLPDVSGPGTGPVVTIWGYTDVDPTLGGVVTIPGPAIIANQGEILEIILHNNLTASTSLQFRSMEMVPDLTGIAAGGSKTYTFTANQAGAFLYEPGLLPNAQHQAAMGMVGALIVRPAGAPNQAYADPTTSFNAEALMLLSEIDPNLNNAADPAAFDMRDFNPRYFLINGKAYPQTDEIPVLAGEKLLLRYLNAGLETHTMGLLGLDQALLSNDGNPLTFSRSVVAESIYPGQSMDMMVTIPAVAPVGGGNYAAYDTNLMLHNSNVAGFGGMLTFITLADGGSTPVGPTTTMVQVNPSYTDGSVLVDLLAVIPGATSAEYFIDSQGADGTGTAMSAGVNADEWIASVDVSALLSGDHSLYVHGNDGVLWGSYNFAVLHMDKDGPLTKSVVLTPNPSAGAVNVSINATADDTQVGNTDVIAAEYFIDTPGADGSGTAMAINQTAPIANLTAVIDASVMSTLAEGEHTLFIHAQDAFMHWGALVSVALKVDQTGPETSAVSVAPSPNNGSTPYSPSQYSVRVDATFSDPAVGSGSFAAVNSNIQKAEGFIDTVGADGTGFPLTPRDGLFNTPVEQAYAFIPLSTINALSQGVHQILIHAQDASGNWGTTLSGELVIDKVVPTVSNLNVTPNPTGGAPTVDISAEAADADSAIVTAEWFTSLDPGRGNATPMTVTANGANWALSAVADTTAWTPGPRSISVRAKDAAGNWSSVSKILVTVEKGDAIFADSFESGNTSAWSGVTSTGGNLNITAAAAMRGGSFGMAVTTTGNTPGFVIDNSPVSDLTYHARFYYNPNGALTGNTQQTIFAGYNGEGGTGTRILRIDYRRRNAQGGTYELRASVLVNGAWVNTGWFPVINNNANAVEISWASSTSASFSFYINGALRQTLTNRNTSAYRLESVILGPSSGLIAASNGTQYFDEFVSTRYSAIGLAASPLTLQPAVITQPTLSTAPAISSTTTRTIPNSRLIRRSSIIRN